MSVFKLYLASVLAFILSSTIFPVLSAPLSPADRNIINQDQQDLLLKNQHQRDELQRALTPVIDSQPQSLGSAGPCFNIHHVNIDGAMLISDKKRREFELAYVNQCIGMGEIKKLINDISDWYIQRGY
ncbi:POTRA domain-containing protein, partial [Buttiauxella noackiae]|uniref:POTRA domain-containing protein n=1 Tax=Buttiauxella noackiae TaxID=82992 RepID=UPI002352D0C0